MTAGAERRTVGRPRKAPASAATARGRRDVLKPCRHRAYRGLKRSLWLPPPKPPPPKAPGDPQLPGRPDPAGEACPATSHRADRAITLTISLLMRRRMPSPITYLSGLVARVLNWVPLPSQLAVGLRDGLRPLSCRLKDLVESWRTIPVHSRVSPSFSCERVDVIQGCSPAPSRRARRVHHGGSCREDLFDDGRSTSGLRSP